MSKPHAIILSTAVLLLVVSRLTVTTALLIVAAGAALACYLHAVGWRTVGAQLRHITQSVRAWPWWAQALVLAAIWVFVPLGSWIVLGAVVLLARRDLATTLSQWRDAAVNLARTVLRVVF